MKTFIAAVLISLRARMGLLPTTDSAIAGVTKAIDQLNAVVAREEALIERQKAVREAARQQINAAALRSDRAERIASRFSALIQE